MIGHRLLRRSLPFVVGLAGTLWAGYDTWREYDLSGRTRKAVTHDGEPLSDDPADPMTSLVTDSITPLQAAFASCSPIPSACKLAVTGIGGVRGSSEDSAQEGLNIDPNAFQGGMPHSQTDIYKMAGTLAHEAFHLLWGPTGRIGSEQAALEAHAAVPCCLKQSAERQGMGAGPMDTVCAEWRRVPGLHYCTYDGRAALEDCGCRPVPWFWCGTTGSHVGIDIFPDYGDPQLQFPRPDIDPAGMAATTCYYTSAAGFFEVSLYPASSGDQLAISRYDGSSSTEWTFDISSRQEGTLLPFLITPGGAERVFLAGRIQETGKTVIYEVRIPWSGSMPAPAFTTLYHGSEIGDITGLGFVDMAPEVLAVFDWTNARLSYLRIPNGSVQHLADPSVYPALSLMAGLHVEASRKMSGTPSGLILFLQPVQIFLDNPDAVPGMIELRFVDELADGTVDSYEGVDF